MTQLSVGLVVDPLVPLNNVQIIVGDFSSSYQCLLGRYIINQVQRLQQNFEALQNIIREMSQQIHVLYENHASANHNANAQLKEKQPNHDLVLANVATSTLDEKIKYSNLKEKIKHLKTQVRFVKTTSIIFNIYHLISMKSPSQVKAINQFCIN